MQINEEEKQRTLNQLEDMFCGLSLDRVRSVCEQCEWNVEKSIDFLINVNTAAPESTASQCGSRWRDKKFQFQHGAIPKQSSAPPQFQLKSATKQETRLPNNNNGFSSPEERRVSEQIRAGYKVMIIMRGAPGSGKTHLARRLVESNIDLKSSYTHEDFILSTDDYFYDSSGRYKFCPERLEDAHKFNQRRAKERAAAGWSPIIIDNTNMQLWEMLPYAQTALRHGYLLELLESRTPWRHSAGRLAAKNRHRVPREKLQVILDKYEKSSTGNLIKMLKNPKYTVSLPQIRTQPPVCMEKEAGEEYESFLLENDTFAADSKCSNKEVPDVLGVATAEPEEAWGTYDANAPKQQRENSKLKKQQVSPPPPPADVPAKEDFTPTNAWQPYEQESAKYWNMDNSLLFDKKPTVMKSEKSLLDLLKEGVSEVPVRPPPKKAEVNENNDYGGTDTNEGQKLPLERHSINCCNENKSFVSLRQIYPNKELNGLWDLFVKCNANVDWVVDILLKEDELRTTNDQQFFDPPNEVVDEFICQCRSDDIHGQPATAVPATPSALTLPLIVNNVVKPQRQRARASRTNANEFLEARETIENCFVLGEEYYSPHLRKLRERATAPPKTPRFFADSETQTEPTLENDELLEENGELLEISLGDNLVSQLRSIFKEEAPLGEQLPENVNTNVFIPRALAKELYMLWVESVFNQVEEQRQQTMREDESFARLLKNPKYENYMQTPGNVHELLDMELAWEIYKSDADMDREDALKQKQQRQPNDLASHLTHMMLCQQFPDIPRETLLDVMVAHNNNYTETVQVLRSTMGGNNDQAEINTLTQKQLFERALRENELLNQEAQKQLQRERFSNEGSVERNFRSPLQPDEAKRLALRDFEDTRNLAAHHCQLKAECYQKAKEAIQKGNSSVAVYYSEIANLHKMKIDMYNHRAANCIMDVHKYTQNNPDLLDLHYLHVVEAVGCLDLFLDRHITVLRAISRSYKHVFIITGRGLHSAGGVSTIKNKVKSRLKERNLRWSEVNPGLLKVKLFSASRHSKNI